MSDRVQPARLPCAIDCVLDLLPPAANATQVRASLMTVRPYGRVVLMGGVAHAAAHAGAFKRTVLQPRSREGRAMGYKAAYPMRRTPQ